MVRCSGQRTILKSSYPQILISSLRESRLDPTVDAVPLRLWHGHVLRHRLFDDDLFQQMALLQMWLQARVGGVIVRAGAVSAVAGQAVGIDDAFDVFGVRQIGVGQVAGRSLVVGIVAAFAAVPIGGTKCQQAQNRGYLS